MLINITKWKDKVFEYALTYLRVADSPSPLDKEIHAKT